MKIDKQLQAAWDEHVQDSPDGAVIDVQEWYAIYWSRIQIPSDDILTIKDEPYLVGPLFIQ